jgi:hypothetical protein
MAERETITELADAMLAFAQRMIRQHRQFYPFGGLLDDGGDVEIVSGDLGGPWSGSEELAGLLWESLEARGSDARGVAVDEGNEIRLEIRHRGDIRIRFVQPYRQQKLGKKVEFGPVSTR